MFAKAVEALLELGSELIESLGFDGVLHLVVEPSAAEPPLDDRSSKTARAWVRTTVSRAWTFPWGTTLHERTSQLRVLAAELFGQLLGQFLEVGIACGWARTSKLSDHTPCGGPLAKKSATSLGASTGPQSLGRSIANLYSR